MSKYEIQFIYPNGTKSKTTQINFLPYVGFEFEGKINEVAYRVIKVQYDLFDDEKMYIHYSNTVYNVYVEEILNEESTKEERDKRVSEGTLEINEIPVKQLYGLYGQFYRSTFYNSTKKSWEQLFTINIDAIPYIGMEIDKYKVHSVEYNWHDELIHIYLE